MSCQWWICEFICGREILDTEIWVRQYRLNLLTRVNQVGRRPISWSCRRYSGLKLLVKDDVNLNQFHLFSLQLSMLSKFMNMALPTSRLANRLSFWCIFSSLFRSQTKPSSQNEKSRRNCHLLRKVTGYQLPF